MYSWQKEVKPFTDGLTLINKINPVWFQYNGKGGMPNDGKNYVGIIAQEMKETAPYTIDTFKDKESHTEYYNYDAELKFKSQSMSFSDTLWRQRK